MSQATGPPAGWTAAAPLRRRRFAAQLLHRPPGLAVAAAVRHLLAVQAQDARSARLALRARIGGLRRADVDACGELVVTWLMRGTLHLVHLDDLPWLHALTAPPRRTSNAARLRRLGVDAHTTDRALGLLRAELSAGPASRDRLGAALAAGGVAVAGQALPHLLMRAALDGIAVRDLHGAFRAVEIPAVDRGDALRDLARRYASAHPEATARDLATWAGLPLRDVREGAASEWESPDRGASASPRPSARIGGGPERRPGQAPLPARLLPPFDPYLLDWKDRAFAVPPALAAQVAPGGGTFRATAVADGRVVGTWGAAGGKVTLGAGVHPAAFAAEVADVERFLVS